MMERDQRTKNAVVFTTRTQQVEKPTCRHCGKYGHEEANCYEIIGYPPNWGSRGRGCGSRGGRPRQGGKTVGGIDHGPRREAVHATTIQTKQATTHDTATDATQVSIPGLSLDQIQRLLSLIDMRKGGYEKLSGKSSWMIDVTARP